MKAQNIVRGRAKSQCPGGGVSGRFSQVRDDSGLSEQ